MDLHVACPQCPPRSALPRAGRWDDGGGSRDAPRRRHVGRLPGFAWSEAPCGKDQLTLSNPSLCPAMFVWRPTWLPHRRSLCARFLACNALYLVPYTRPPLLEDGECCDMPPCFSSSIFPHIYLNFLVAHLLLTLRLTIALLPFRGLTCFCFTCTLWYPGTRSAYQWPDLTEFSRHWLWAMKETRLRYGIAATRIVVGIWRMA
jgi:hypothetical protein